MAEATPLAEVEWNFDNVPEKELAACVYWEYARESAFIRDVRRRCMDPRWWKMSKAELWDYCGYDIERIQSIGYAANVFLPGFFFDEAEDRKPRHPEAPPITGCFPRPWQTLSEEERKSRARIGREADVLRLQPFQVAHWGDAQELARYVELQVRKLQAAPRPDQGHPPIRPGVFISNAETLLVEIAWRHFTDDEIATAFRQSLKALRPKHASQPDRRGHKPRDLRVALDRLGMMRLLHHWTLREMPVQCPAGWKAFQGYDWYKERKRAKARFRQLFKFLPPSEQPLSWPTEGGRRK